MRAAAILGLGTSIDDLKPFQEGTNVEWVIGLPSDREAVDATLIFGGDGTVHRHLGALVKLGLPVLVVPAGSGNDFARALGLEKIENSVVAWRKWTAGGQNLRAIDLGVITTLSAPATPADDAAQGYGARTSPRTTVGNANSLPMPEGPASSLGSRSARERSYTYFSCAAGVGLDGEIARRANAMPRWLRGHGGYALSLAPALFAFQAFRLKLASAPSATTDSNPRGSEQTALAAVFANTPVYGGGMRIAPRAKMDDGQLDICLIRDISKLKLLAVFPSVYLGRHLGIRGVEYYSTGRVFVETEQPMDVYADGEYVCRTPVEVSVARAALRVVVR
jgi:diacylglycerol kinase (ATP)